MPTKVPDSDEEITRVLAIDGSIVSEQIRNGFPGAEASLVQIALVHIDLTKLNEHAGKRIIPPSAFSNMDHANTLQCVLPGRNVVKNDGTEPRDFFRSEVYEALQGGISEEHETLLETYRALVANRDAEFVCPKLDCDKKLKPKNGVWSCPCAEKYKLFETDPLRFHERFNEVGTNGEPHNEVMRFLEVILLLNVLRYFAKSRRLLRALPRIAFVVDGPLAAFGQFAAIVPYVQTELARISELCRRETGKDLLLFSLIKSGQFYEHFEAIDYDNKHGPDKKFAPGTLLLPDIAYIHESVVYRSPNAKPWGADTYFGRVALYKNMSGHRMVVNTAKTTPQSEDLDDISLAAYPRISEIKKILDRLSTYFFEGGFVPIVRAHSHAAIPLKKGGEILRSLFDE